MYYVDHVDYYNFRYHGIEYIAVPPNDLWIPSFALINSAADDIINEKWYKLYKTVIFHNGTVNWVPSGNFEADCPVDVYYFPFDEQLCHFNFEEWVYDVEKVNLSYNKLANDHFIPSNVHSTQWTFLDVNIKILKEDHLGYNYPIVQFSLRLKRKSLFYVINILILSILLQCLVLMIFKLPIESGERMSMGVAILLSFILFILMVNNHIPETSDSIPIIVIYLHCAIALTTLSIGESVFALWCFHQNSDNRMPFWLRKLACLNTMDKRFIVVQVKSSQRCTSKDNGVCNNANASRPESALNHTNVQCLSENKCLTGEYVLKEWRSMATRCDYICFWLFLGVDVILIFILFIFIPASRQPKLFT